MDNILYKPNVFNRAIPYYQKNKTSGEASFELLSDFLTCLNDQNKSNLENVSSACGRFKEGRLVEHAVLICEELGLETFVAYHGTEILERFIVKHIENLFLKKSDGCDGVTCGTIETNEDLIFESLREKLYMFIVSSLQIASKLTLHSNVIDNRLASRYLQSLERSCTKDTLLESELLILKTLDFKVNVQSPLSYVETLLEVLAHNDPAIPVSHLHHLCRAKFVSVTDDYMLLGAGVITVAAFIYHTSWEKVAEELALVTGISVKSIIYFAHVTLLNITKNNMMDNVKETFTK